MSLKLNLRDELHDIRAVGGVRNYLFTLYQIKRSNREWRRAQALRDQGFEPDISEPVTLRERWNEHRDGVVQRRVARKERRLMKTSTFDALSEALDDDERDPYTWGQSELEAALADTAAVEKRRWLERAQWIVLLFIAAGLGGVGGWYLQPQYVPKPIACTVLVHGEGKETSVVRCEGVPE